MKKAPRILLRSSWQTVNIGDVSHTPGILRLLEEHFPEAEIWLWPKNVSFGAKEMLERRFPELKVVEEEKAVNEAFSQCDFMLHSSGPFLIAEKDVEAWRKQTGKPYGVFGISLNELTDDSRAILNEAQFVFFRDTASLGFARENGVSSPVMAFGPDAAFATDVRDDAAADAFLAANHLQEGEFVCCIPRYRYSPYWAMHVGTPFHVERHRYNERMKEQDHAPLRAAIEAVVRQTDKKVLICAEDQSQVALGWEMLYEKLPTDVRHRVVWRDRFWLTDEALSTYTRSAGLFGLEMHSPIMCVGNGVPAMVCRFQEQTSKGIMWRDIGLDQWLFDMDQPADVERLVPTVLAMVEDREASLRLTKDARRKVESLQAGMVERLKGSLET